MPSSLVVPPTAPSWKWCRRCVELLPDHEREQDSTECSQNIKKSLCSRTINSINGKPKSWRSRRDGKQYRGLVRESSGYMENPAMRAKAAKIRNSVCVSGFWKNRFENYMRAKERRGKGEPVNTWRNHHLPALP